MTRTCSVPGCKGRKGPRKESLQFFRFPLKNEKVLQSWLLNVNRKDFVPSKNSTLCSDHFKESDYLVRPGTYVRKLKPDAVPTLLLSTFPQDLQKNASTPIFLKKEDTSNCINNFQEIANPIKSSNSVPIPDYREISSAINVLKDHAYCRKIANSIESTSTGVDANDIFLNEVDKGVQTDRIIVKKQISILKKPKNIVEKELKHKIRMLQQKIRRRDKYIAEFKNLLKQLKQEGILQLEGENLLEEEFQEQSSEVLNASDYDQSMQNLDL